MSDRACLERHALDALISARATLLETHPFLATLCLRLTLVPVWDSRVPTAATDGVRIYFRPDWMLSLPRAHQQFVLAHEVGHCALGHLRRTATRHHRAWNLAMDHEINALLRDEHLQSPDDAIYFPEHHGRSAEYVFDRLATCDTLPESGEHTGVHLPHGVILSDEPEYDPRFQPTLDHDQIEQWPTRVRAAAEARRQRGTQPGHLERRVQAALGHRTLPWRELLAAFLTRTAHGGIRWLPPSRRHIHRGLYLPSRRGDEIRVAIAVDTSGSTEPYLEAFAAEALGLVQAFPRYRLTWIPCDTRIGDITTFDESQPVTASDLSFEGGGGTDLRPPFAWLQSQPEPPSVLIYLTDGLGPAPESPPHIPVLWVLTPGGEPPATWGQVARMRGEDHATHHVRWSSRRVASGRRPRHP